MSFDGCRAPYDPPGLKFLANYPHCRNEQLATAQGKRSRRREDSNYENKLKGKAKGACVVAVKAA
jgi:hypothetical protein